MNNIANIIHVRKALPGGGQVVVLNTDAAINPESEAMLQALHSRSIEGIDGHLEVLAEKGSEKFMSTYYVGYGHKSIGDCGSATIFIEGVSMLAAKAIQDWKLYSGQESSTRYIDFTSQAFLNPLGSEAGEKILETWRGFYLKAVAEMKEVLKERYPISEGEKETVYEKAIAARAFDTTRGFLPAGATTNLAWHGNLRQFADKVQLLRHHPLSEVKDIAQSIDTALLEAFPNSFSEKRYEATETYHAEVMKHYYYHEPDCPLLQLVRDSVDKGSLEKYRSLLENRPAHTELPKWMGVFGEIEFKYLLDFGSFRDIQRHRALTQRMPLLTSDIGFNEWYLNELSSSLRQEAEETIEKLKAATNDLPVSQEEKQYYIPMGYNTSNNFSSDLPALLYMVELRATRFVHPTLRQQAAAMAKLLEEQYKDIGLVIHLDSEMDRFDIKRGEHDIVKQ
ncbi:MAG: FAD-dependent thymidylate synthase [Candidatus Paceibacterota bacterium]